jgi:hypothetical protein
MTNSKLTFQNLFQRYLATFSLQSRIPAIYSSREVSANLIKNFFSITPQYDVVMATKLSFLNNLYKYQHNYEIDRLVAQKFSKSDVVAVDGTEAKFHKKELELKKMKQRLQDTTQFDIESKNYNYLGLYHYLIAKNGAKEMYSNFFGLSNEDRLGHVLISGNAGFGKSSLMKNMFLQDTQNSLGGVWISNDRNNTHEILNKIPGYRAKDIIYLKPNDANFSFGIDLFDGANQDTIIETVIDIFKNIWQGEQTDKISYFLEPILYLILKNPDLVGFSEYQKIINNFNFRNQLLENCTDRKVLEFWNNYKKSDEADMQSTLIKLESINRNQIIRDVIDNQVRQARISDILNNNKILVLDLSELPDGNVSARFLGNLILKKVSQLCNERNREKSKLFSVYVDEFSSYSGEDLFSKVSNLRKNNVSLVYSQQGTYDKKEKMELGSVCFGSFVNRITFNTSDPYSRFVNHDEDLELDSLIKNLPKLTCLFEGVIKGFPINPILLDVVQGIFGTDYNNSRSINSPEHFFSRVRNEKVSAEFVPALTKMNVAATSTTSKEPKQKSSSPKPNSSDNPFLSEIKDKTAGEIRIIIQDLEKSLKFDSAGKPRKNKLNGVRRKSIENRIILAKEVLSRK